MYKIYLFKIYDIKYYTTVKNFIEKNVYNPTYLLNEKFFI